MTADVVQRAGNLFEFLRRAQQLKTRSVTDVEKFARVLWFADCPDHESVHTAHNHEAPSADEPLLVVDRVPHADPPEPDPELAPWLRGELNKPEKAPQLRAEIVLVGGARSAGETHSAGGRADPDEADQSERTVPLDDRPDIRRAYEGYVRDWEIWAEKELADRPARDYYNELFETYVEVRNNPEQFELVSGTGCLSWEPDGHAPVRRHMVTCPLGISFDDDTGRLTVHRVEAPVAFKIERDMLDPGLVNNAENVNAVEAEARDLPVHPLHRDDVGTLVRRLVHSLDADGEYRDEDVAARPGRHAMATFAPAIILRNRGQQGMVEIFQTIVERLADAEEVPRGILPLIDPDNAPESESSGHPGAVVYVDDEPFLPMPVNDKQLEIIKRVDVKPQVLVQGPPGTGKTYTAGALIAHLLAQGKRVLVTAQTDRALREVRDKLPDQIKPLSVGVVGSSQEDMADLKVAVQEIATATAEYDGDRNAREIQRCLDSLDRLRRERAELHHQLVAAREHEVIEREHAGYMGTLAAIARQLSAQQDRYGWLLEFGQVGANEQPPLSNGEIAEWRNYLLDAELIVEEPHSRLRLLELAALPTAEAFAQQVADERRAAESGKAHEQLKSHTAFDSVLRLSTDQREQLRSRLHELAEEADALAGRREQWMDGALSDVRSGRASTWQGRGRLIDQLIAHCSPQVQRLGALTEVSLPDGDPGPLVTLATELRSHLADGGKIKTNPDGSPKFGMFTAGVVKQAQPVFERVRVNGLPPTTVEQLDTFLTWAEATRTLAALDKAWPENVHIPAEDTLHERLQWHVTELEQLHRVLALGEQLETEERALAAAGLPAPNWNDLQDVRTYARLVDAAAAEEAWTAAATPLRELENTVGLAAQWEQAASCVGELHAAVAGRDPNGYANAYRGLDRLWQVRSMTERRATLQRRLDEQAPALSRALTEDPAGHAWGGRLAEFEQAWAWASARTWVREQKPGDINALQAAVTRAENAIRHQVETMAARRAWDHAASPQRITPGARADLTQYAQLVKRAGKMSGRYGAQRRAEVRAAMERCRPSVPVWIMPLYRIAEQLRVEPDMFDVVIVDEASQTGTEATFLQYLAKKIVVIGDDKQVSPAAVGIEQQQLRDLAGQYIADDPYRSSWQDPKRSLFDEAKMRYGGLITLTEHRRCVPEIIGFSNRIAYEPDGIGLVPVRQYGTDRLDPIKAVHVTDGYVQGTTHQVNTVEVEAIVERIEKCIADPAYDDKTFGVISLLGPAQARKIQDALLKRLPNKEWTARDLRCGDAADFQGSERDVMFLSMVKAPEDGRRISPLIGDTYVQRFNVAVSRAKEQVWVFHSLDLQQLHNSEDMRFALLDYCYGVINRANGSDDGGDRERVPENERVEPFDSLFEQRVYNRIIDRGYTVHPQYESAGYRIDLVVLGGQRRLAIECDGDFWHGPEQYERDLARQRDLERCGWQFLRITGSSFDVDPAAALAGLWEALAELDIHPAGHVRDSGPVTVEVEPGGDTAPPTSAPAERAGAYEGYVEFSGEVVPVSEATAAQLRAGIEEIARAEGPIVGDRLHTVYVRASGGSRVGNQIARDLNSAISAAVRRGALVADSPLDESEVKPRTYRVPDQPRVRVRDLGPRDLSQVPPAELAAMMAATAQDTGWDNDESIFKTTLERLGLKRLTKQVREHLEPVLDLAKGEYGVDGVD